MITLYHNPRCSKSRSVLDMLRDRGVDLEIVDYQKTPPPVAVLSEMIRLSGLLPSAFVRTEDAGFRESGVRLDADAAVDTVAQVLADNPGWLQRPIVRSGSRVVICRPPQRCLEFVPERSR